MGRRCTFDVFCRKQAAFFNRSFHPSGHGISSRSAEVSIIPSSDLSLINGNSFHDELDRRREGVGTNGWKDPERTTLSDAFDALESGLPITSGERDFADSNPEHELIRFPREAAAGPAARPAMEMRLPLAAAAAVIGFCLLVGGAIAVLVFHEQAMNITVSWMASR